jgi:FtsZ-binding cell division protein ZapB
MEETRLPKYPYPRGTSIASVRAMLAPFFMKICERKMKFFSDTVWRDFNKLPGWLLNITYYNRHGPTQKCLSDIIGDPHHKLVAPLVNNLVEVISKAGMDIELLMEKLVMYDATLAGWREKTLLDQQTQEAQEAQEATETSIASVSSEASSLTSEEIKSALGEKLFPLIYATQPELAGKITGMILELEPDEISSIINDSDKLKEKITEALEVLQEYRRSNPLPSPDTIPMKDGMSIEQLIEKFYELNQSFDGLRQSFDGVHTEHQALRTENKALRADNESLRAQLHTLREFLVKIQSTITASVPPPPEQSGRS